MREKTLTYRASDRALFRRGILWKRWAREYPGAFDEVDVRLIARRAPRGRLFGEWLAAAHYARQGYRVLIGKYQFARAHPRKNETFRRVAPMPVAELLTLGGAFQRRQGPDLFVYSPNERRWFFAEVKGPREALSSKQVELFNEIEHRSGGKDIVIIRPVCV